MNTQIIKNRLRKIIAYFFTGAVFLLLSSFLLLQAPPIQQRLIDRFLGDLTQLTGFKTSVKSFRLLWFDRLELEQVLIEDNEHNEMIAVEHLRVNFKLFQMLRGRDVNIDGIAVTGAHVLLKNIAESDSSRNLNINIFIKRINEHYASSSSGGTPPVINIGEAVLQKSAFIYDDGSLDSVAGFDYHHFSIAVDDAALNKFVILGDTIEFNVESLIAKDQETGLELKQLSTFFRISQKAMEFYGLNLRAGESTFSNTVVFQYNSQRDFSNFNQSITLQASLNDCIIDPNDLALFAPGVDRIQYPIRVSGNFKGKVNKFRFTDMKLNVGNSELKGKLSMDGLPVLEETFIEIDLNNSSLDFNNLSFIVTDPVIDRLLPLGRTKLSGQFIGYVNDFVAKGIFNTSVGTVSSDINVKINQSNADRSTYSGNLSLLDFDLGKYLKDTITFQKVNLNGNIVGAGLSASSADFVLNSTVKSLGIKQYEYKNITTNARFAGEFFSGSMAINDPNLKALMRGSIDLRQNRNTIQMQGQIDTANVHLLHLSKDDLFVSTHVTINSKGLVLDSLEGTGELTNLKVRYKNREMQLASIVVTSKRKESARELSLTSSIADATLKGNFYFSDIFRDIQSLSAELQLNIINDSLRTAAYYKQTKNAMKEYAASFNMNIKNIKPITEVFNVSLTLSPNVLVEGSFTTGITTLLNAYTDVARIQYGDYIFENSSVEVSTSKLVDSTSVLAMIFVQSEKQSLQKINTENLITEAIWNKNHIDFSIDADQQKSSNNLRLKGSIDFRDSTYLGLKNSSFTLLDKMWRVNDEAIISLRGKEWRLQNTGFFEGNQKINAHGDISENASLPLLLTFENINLASFQSLTTEKMQGLVQADVALYNLYDTVTIENSIQVTDFIIADFLVGNITGKNKWNTVEKKFMVDFLVNRQGIEAVNLTGYYDPANEVSPLNVDAKLNQASLRLAQPILRGLFSQIDGTLTGDFSIKGTFNKPLVRGIGLVTNGQIMVDYLQTLYRFNGSIGMTPSSVYFENINLTDTYNNKGKLEGFIAHRNFNTMRLNIDGSFSNFMTLNTSERDNSLFYGQAFATGKVNFFGPVSNLKISADLKTERNTKLFIPIGGTGSVDKKEFINFVSFNDTTINNVLAEDFKKVLTGVNVDLNLDITEDAYCEIIFDKKVGDIIRGRGNGDLRLQLDTKGEFNMFGGITFEEGGYNFTLYNLINKEFEIQKGSRITWSGNPYEAQMNIHAAYNQLASLAPIILDAENQSDPVLRRKYPLQVLLKLDGPMLSPQINFDIVAKDLPQSVSLTNGQTKRLSFEFEAFKAKLDEQELKKQVFSLIILRRLSPLNETISTSGSVTNSVSELLSNQLSYWMSQVDENFEIDVDLSGLDQDAFNTFQYRLSYTFFNGRLRVTRDGTLGNQQNTVNTTTTNANSNTATLVGDWTVDYLLTADGKFKVRMYNRTNANPIQTALNNQNPITTGVSLQHTQTFNTLRDLWQRAREQKEYPDPATGNNTEAVLKEQEDSEND